MQDVIRIEGLRLRALVGVYPHERHTRQPLVIDIDLYTDVREAAEQRDFSKTLDYQRAVDLAGEVVAQGHHKLIETVAELIASALKAEFAGELAKVRVRVAKPRAIPDARTVAVEIER